MDGRTAGRGGLTDPLVSIVLAVRNGARFLREALDSVLAQDYRPIEVVVVDGGSTDDTVAIALAVPGVEVLSEPVRGLARAWNIGVAATRGPLVAFQCHDDVWTPGRLRRQVDHLRVCPELGLVAGRARFFVEPGVRVPPGFRRGLLDGDHPAWLPEASVMRREVLGRVGPFNGEFGSATDADWLARARDLAVPSAMLPDVVLHKRIHEANMSLADPENGRHLLRALRDSVARKRTAR